MYFDFVTVSEVFEHFLILYLVMINVCSVCLLILAMRSMCLEILMAHMPKEELTL